MFVPRSTYTLNDNAYAHSGICYDYAPYILSNQYYPWEYSRKDTPIIIVNKPLVFNIIYNAILSAKYSAMKSSQLGGAEAAVLGLS